MCWRDGPDPKLPEGNERIQYTIFYAYNYVNKCCVGRCTGVEVQAGARVLPAHLHMHACIRSYATSCIFVCTQGWHDVIVAYLSYV